MYRIIFSCLILQTLTGSVWNFEADHIAYYHSHSVTREEMEKAAEINAIFEIDLCWAHNSFHPNIVEGKPYIGHPEEFYTLLGKPFPENNVCLDEFKQFLHEHPKMRVLLDLKDSTVYPYLEEFIKEFGAERCMVHAFIKEWTKIPEGTTPDPHWYREDVELEPIDTLLSNLGVPLLANCRGFSDEHIEKHNIFEKVISDSKKAKSIIALGIYYPSAPLPRLAYLKAYNEAGFYAWLNKNNDDADAFISQLRTIAMSDYIDRCTKF